MRTYLTPERLTDGGVSVDRDDATLGAPGLEEVAVKLEDAGGPGPRVEAVNVLGDHDNFAPLASEPVLDLRYRGVGGVGLLGAHDLPPVVVELPDK